MNRFLLFLVLSLSVVTTLQAQRQPGTSDKKALAAFNKALEANNARQYKAAIEQAQRAASYDENFADPYMLMGQLYAETGEFEKAITSYERVLELDPDFSSEAYYLLGRLYFIKMDYATASGHFKTYLGRKQRKPSLDAVAKKFLVNSEFSAEAIKHPQPFDPKNLGEAINSPMGEYYPGLTADDNTIYYTRRLIDRSHPQGFQEDFFVSTMEKDGWNKSRNLGAPINTSDHNEGAPTISADGRIMVFVVCEAMGDGDYGNKRTGFGSCDLFIAHKEGNSWVKAENIGESINSVHWETQPSLSSDGRTLYFIRGFRDKSRTITGQDIWISEMKDDGKWSEAKRLEGKINTPGQESSVMIHPDGNTLYFASDGHPGFGGEDIFVSYKEGTEWGEPKNLGYPINTSNDENSLTVSAGGEVAYFASDRAGGLGGLDLYSFILPENVRPLRVSYVKGLVSNAKTGAPLEASFQLIDLETKNVVISSKSDKILGEFLVTLAANKDYALNVSKPGFLFHSENFSLKEGSGVNEPIRLDIKLSPIEKGEIVVLRNVFFDTDKFDLKPTSEAELDKLADFLDKNPALRIELGGHTDDQGDAVYNQKLSENRAKAVLTYLVNTKGIAASRLTAAGYGESKPIEDNATAEGRALNRRTEFKVL
ncbi:MAG: OmpA family protein [Bacteroidota bacterium]